MNYKKLIDMYLVGDLNLVEKDLLFRELSTNEELREYFEEQINFNQIFFKDYQTITVPSELTNDIFAKLNFNIPNTNHISTTIPQPAFIEKLKTHFSKFIPYFASSILGSVCTFLLLWLFIPYPRLVTTINEGSNLSNEIGIPVGHAIEMSKASVESGETNQLDKFERTFLRALDKYLSKYLQNNNQMSLKPVEVLQNENPEIIEQTNTKHASQNIVFRSFKQSPIEIPRNFGFTSKSILTEVSSPNQVTKRLKNITLGFRGYSMNSYPNVNVNLGEKGVLTNTGISIGYNLLKNTNVGFEFGQEKFSQQYTLKRYGELTYYKQNPLLWWYGFYLQQNIDNMFILNELKPFARIFLGGTPVGPLARGSLGIQYSPDARVALFLGWEVSYLGYKVQENIYQTKKSGVTYGVTLKY